MGLVQSLQAIPAKIVYATNEAITDTSTHSYYGLGGTTPYRVDQFQYLAIDISNSHNQIATVTVYGRMRGTIITTYTQIGPSIAVAATSGHETRTIDLNSQYFEMLRIDVIFASSPSSGNIDIIAHGVKR